MRAEVQLQSAAGLAIDKEQQVGNIGNIFFSGRGRTIAKVLPFAIYCCTRAKATGTIHNSPFTNAHTSSPLDRLSLLQGALYLVEVLRDAPLLHLEGVLHLRPVLGPVRRQKSQHHHHHRRAAASGEIHARARGRSWSPHYDNYSGIFSRRAKAHVLHQHSQIPK